MSSPDKLHTESCGWVYNATKRVPLDGETDMKRGFTTVPDGKRVCDFEIVVDVDKLIRAVGRRAAFSARGVTKLQAGAVVVKVSKKTRED